MLFVAILATSSVKVDDERLRAAGSGPGGMIAEPSPNERRFVVSVFAGSDSCDLDWYLYVFCER